MAKSKLTVNETDASVEIKGECVEVLKESGEWYFDSETSRAYLGLLLDKFTSSYVNVRIGVSYIPDDEGEEQQ
jgi:hypothetical protein